MMQIRFLTTVTIAVFSTLVSLSSHALITLSFDPTPAEVSLNDTIAVDLIADIPAAESINSWGLDISFDSSVLTLNSFTKGPIWTGGLGSCSLDDDEICGSALVPSINGSSLLGTFNFTAIGIGSSALDLSVTEGDITEGFRLVVPASPIGGSIDWNYSAGLVNVGPSGSVSEPAILTLMAFGIAAIGFFKRKST